MKPIEWAHLTAHDKTIIAASPVMGAPSELPHRIVIRDQDQQFVVHMEVLQDAKPYYTTGNYVPKGNDPAEALRTAWQKFDFRVRRMLGISIADDKLKQVSDIAESIIKQLLELAGVDGEDALRDELANDYLLDSNLETFENLTGKKIRPEAAETEES